MGREWSWREARVKGREEWASLLRGKLKGRVLGPLGGVRDVAPMAQGKKGLVFLVEGDLGRGVLRLYGDPLVLARTRKVYGLCRGAGVSVARICLFEVGGRWLRHGVWGVSLEEWVDAWRGGGEPVLFELARLHTVRRSRWGDPLWGRQGEWLDMEMERVHSRLERWSQWLGVDVSPYREWLEEMRRCLTPLESYSLVHGDVALANLGARGEDPVLLDLDRAFFAHPLLDVAALVHHFPGIGKESLDDYLSVLGFTPRDWTFFLFLFHLKRLVRALKHYRKGEEEWGEVVQAHGEWLESVVKNGGD